jgi:hypothetical protein
VQPLAEVTANSSTPITRRIVTTYFRARCPLLAGSSVHTGEGLVRFTSDGNSELRFTWR